MDKNILSFSHHICIISMILSAFSILFLSSSSTFAEETIIDDIDITVPVSCSLSGAGTGTHNASIANGTYVPDIGTTTLKAYCNDTSGFAIYAIGFTNDEYSGNNHTKLIGSSANNKIITGTATSAGNPDVSNWAMKLATNSGATYPITIDNSYNNYSLVPDIYTKVAHRDSGTDIGIAATGAELTTTYAVYISKTEAADAYTGKVKYTLVHPATNVPNEPKNCVSGKICYYPNAGNEVLDTMGDETLSATPTLWPSNFIRDGYGFAGWSDAFDWVVNEGSQSNPDAHIYGPNETLSLTTSDYPNGLSLYAVWVKPEGYLQGWTGCSSLASGNVTALIDMRDNDVYAVAKLADGNCWMIENLRLDNTATTGEANEALAQGYGKSASYGNFIGLANPEPTNAGSGTATANSIYYSGTQSGTATIDVGVNAYPALRIPRYYNINTANPTENMEAFDNSDNIYSLGNYYNWPAAVASTSYFSTTNNSVDTSLCPASWHLPTGGKAYAANTPDQPNVTGNTSTFREFYNLGYTVMGNNKAAYEDTANDGNSYYSSSTTNANGDTATKAFRKYPYNFVLSGYFAGSAAGNRGTSGDYWSSTINTYAHAFVLYVNNTKIHPGTYNFSKHNGFVVRCVANS